MIERSHEKRKEDISQDIDSGASRESVLTGAELFFREVFILSYPT